MPPDRELIQAYHEGQVSRRTFIRRLLASGVSLASAMVYADVLWGSPVQAAPQDDFYSGGLASANALVEVTNFAFIPSLVVVPQGSFVGWRWPSPSSPQHSLDGPAGFFDSPMQPDTGPDHAYDSWTRRFPAAGIFHYRCPDPGHPPMEGVVEVPMQRSKQKGPVGRLFVLTWSAEGDLDGGDGAVNDTYVFDVQIKKPAKKRSDANRPARWKNWQNGTRAPSAEYRPKREGRHRFRARLRRLNDGAASDWSRPIAIRAT